MSLPLTFFNDDNFASVERLFEQREERCRLGTSANDSARTNAKAEALAKQAGELKRAGRYEQALTLYTQAIDLDPFNHLYFYHRAELFLQCDIPLATTDAQFGLDLLGTDMNTLRDDDIFCSLWWIMVQSEMKMGELDNAKRFVQVALALVSQDQPLRSRLLTSQRAIQEGSTIIQQHIETDADSVIPVRVHTVMDDGDDFMFFYTSQISLSSPQVPLDKIQPELLAVDLPVEMIMNGDMETFLQHIISQKFKDISAFVLAKSSPLTGQFAGGGEEQQVMEAFQTPDGQYSITPILVVREDDCKILRRHLMCNCRDDCRIVVLKVDKMKKSNKSNKSNKNNKNNDNEAVAGNDPIDGSSTVKLLSEAQAKDHVATIVENASTCQERYKKGNKLVEDQVIHELTKRMNNLISSSSGGSSSTGPSKTSHTK